MTEPDGSIEGADEVRDEDSFDVAAVRAWLAEQGTDLAEDVEVRVWDSSAELRYMVLPERPEGTERMSEDELAEIVSRDAMIGVVKVPAPALV